MAEIKTNSYDGRFIKLNVWEESTDVLENTSTVRWVVESVGGRSNNYTIYNFGIEINNQKIIEKQTVSYRSREFPASRGTKSGIIKIKHNDDGSADSITFKLFGSVYNNNNNEYSSTLNLSKIDRFPIIISAYDFNDEENPKIEFQNISKKYNIRCKLEAGGNSKLIYRDLSKDATSCTFVLSEEERQKLRQLSANVNKLNVKFTVCAMENGNELSASWFDRNMNVINANPNFQTNYIDTNNKSINVTTNNKLIVQNISELQVQINNIETYKYATPKKAILEIDGIEYTTTNFNNNNAIINCGEINKSNNVNAKLKIIDSRENERTKTFEIQILEWKLPEANIECFRKNNYYNQTYLKVDCNYSSINNKNNITMNYKYKKWGNDDFSNTSNIQNNQIVELNLDNQFDWLVVVEIEDKFGTTTMIAPINKGTPFVFFDDFNNSIGINCIPEYKNDIAINGTSINHYKLGPHIVVGRWIDGRPIYRGIYTLNGGYSSETLNHWINDLDYVIDARFIAHNHNDNYINRNNNKVLKIDRIDSEKIYLQIDPYFSGDWEIFLILEYTLKNNN